MRKGKRAARKEGKRARAVRVTVIATAAVVAGAVAAALAANLREKGKEKKVCSLLRFPLRAAPVCIIKRYLRPKWAHLACAAQHQHCRMRNNTHSARMQGERTGPTHGALHAHRQVAKNTHTRRRRGGRRGTLRVCIATRPQAGVRGGRERGGGQGGGREGGRRTRRRRGWGGQEKKIRRVCCG